MPKANKKRPLAQEERIFKKTRLSTSDGRKSGERQGTTRKRTFPIWSEKLNNIKKTEDDYIMGTASNLQEAKDILDCHSRYLLCDYIKSYPSQSDIGKKKNVESRILWQSKQIEFDGIPFSSSIYYHYKCSYSVKFKTKARSSTMKDSEDQNSDCEEKSPEMSEVKPSKYTCCPAKVTMKEIIKYPDYVIALDASKLQKKAKLKKLKEDLQSGEDIKMKSKFILSLPLECVHNHEFNGKSRNINRHLKKQIEHFVTGGIKSPKKVKDKLTNFVKEEFKGACPPSKEDGAYYPTLKNIESYINTCNNDHDEVEAEIEPEEQRVDGLFCEPSTLEEAVKIFCSDDLSDEFDPTDSCDLNTIAEKVQQKLEALKRLTYASTDEEMLVNIYNTLVILTDQYISKNEVSNGLTIVTNGHIPEMSVGVPDESFMSSASFNGSSTGVCVDFETSSRSDLVMSSLPPNDVENFQTESVQPVICSSPEDQIALLRQQILLDHDPT